jgi:uncharacterized membrane protein YdjX (TVP38/TMEM64 family)
MAAGTDGRHLARKVESEGLQPMSRVPVAVTPRRFTAAANRYATPVRWLSVVLILVSIVLIFRQLPLDRAIAALEAWVTGAGVWGPVVFGLVYVVAVILLIPASALTLVAGAVFGLLTGVVVVSLASTTGAALALLIGRYLARGRIARKLKQYPRFEAIDRAIGAGGWKVVALLRLSPAVPFNLQNYFYGLTRIGFWTCALTSWVAMLPGTFLYTYLGSAGRAGLEASAGVGRTRTPAEWTLLAIGLLATVGVTVYVTRLARQALKQAAALDRSSITEPPGPTATKAWPWGTTVAAMAALAVLSAAFFLQLNPALLRQLFFKT